jgi:glycosyltransferase involved in cell wall biosynthesis
MLVRVLSSNDHDVSVLCYFEFQNNIVEEFQQTGATVSLLRMNRSTGILSFVNRLRKEIRKIKPDVVHVQYMSPGAMPIVAARLARVKKVFATVHQPYTTNHGFLAKVILRAASLLTTKFIAVSQNAEMSWFGSYSLFQEKKPLRTQKKHFTIYNSVERERVIETTRNLDKAFLKDSLGVPSEVPLIGTVSRLSFEKGIDILLDAYKRLTEDGITCYLVIVGTGPDEEKLKRQATSIGISDRICFFRGAEWRKSMQIMSILDIVVVPSRFEGFGLTAVEAMCLGKPVIASNCGGLKEVLEDKKTGLLFEPGNSDSLVMATKLLLLDSNRIIMGMRGELRARKLFSQDTYFLKIRHLFSSN